jgi:hypothetical protein
LILRHAPLDRANRRPEHRADFVVGVVAGLGEQQRVAQCRRQRANCAADAAPQLAAGHRLFRRRSARRRAIDRRAMPVHELAERGRIALPGPRHQIDVGHTDCRHRRGSRGWEPGLGAGRRELAAYANPKAET